MDEIDQDKINKHARELGVALMAKGWRMVSAESCTGGWISQAVTAVAGSSNWFDRAYVTYSNEAKRDLLGVRQETLDHFGAVSRETVLEMVTGALERSKLDIAVAVTGIAGPDGGTAEKPVGTVWFGFATVGQPAQAQAQVFAGDRYRVREQSVAFALTELLVRARA